MNCPECGNDICDDCGKLFPDYMLYPTDDGELLCHLCLEKREDEAETTRLNEYFDQQAAERCKEG